MPACNVDACFRLPEKIGGNLPGVHYIRDVADADSLVSSLVCSVNNNDRYSSCFKIAFSRVPWY
jgi:hypothetical protein